MVERKIETLNDCASEISTLGYVLRTVVKNPNRIFELLKEIESLIDLEIGDLSCGCKNRK